MVETDTEIFRDGYKDLIQTVKPAQSLCIYLVLQSKHTMSPAQGPPTPPPIYNCDAILRVR